MSAAHIRVTDETFEDTLVCAGLPPQICINIL